MRFNKLPKIYRVGLKYPVWILAVALLLGAFSWHYAKRLTIETDFTTLLPPQSEAVQNFKILNEGFGSMGFLFATVESANKESADQESAKKFARQFADALEALPSIRYVELDWPADFFQKRKWFYLDLQDIAEMERRVDRSLELARLGVSPTFAPLMAFADEEDKPDLTFKDIRKKYEKKFGESFNGRQTLRDKDFILLRIKPLAGAGDVEANKTLMAEVRGVEARLKSAGALKDIKVAYAGDYLSSIETLQLIRSEIFWISLIVFFLLNLIMVLYFRRFSGAVLVGVPLGFGILWTGGIIYFLLGHLNVVTAFGISVLSGLGSDYGIFLLSRYFHEREGGKSHEEACQLAFARTGRATWISMIITAGGFAALMISGFQVFYEFGLVGASGLVLNYLAMMLLMPSLLELGERFKQHRWARLFTWYPKERRLPASKRIFRLFRPSAPGWGVGLALVLVTLSAFTLPKQKQIFFEDGQFETETLPSNQIYRRIVDKLDETLAPTALLVEGSENESKVLRGLTRLLEEEPSEELVFNKVIGVSTFIPEDQEEKRILLARLTAKYQKHPLILPNQKEKFTASIQETLALPNITIEDIPKEIKRNFIAPNADNLFLVALFPSVPRSDPEDLNKYKDGLEKGRQAVGVPYKAVDGELVKGSIVNLINRESGYGFGLLLLFLAGMLVFATQQIKRSLLVFVHLMGALLLVSGVLYLFNIRLNILNIAVIPIILGTNIDCFIHFTERYDEEGDLVRVIDSETGPILMSTLTSMIGLGGFIFTSSPGLQSLGWVAVIGLLLVIAFCILVFPRTLALLMMRRKRMGAKVLAADEA